ncbi:hypothetical protein MYP_2868 [Sporocytophaga myxococcoides]|uniref:Uncharacterized protein n=1 Tax=Sporocytophaga myxococcoides TaxID=153721 RepID=A0A098LGP5_9BACT|nr:hypothetical protein [Sporocytophaga myxococcoides]GAL85639.1 hypothetical protein MYP_2868 [Sporocytophaga myxococcoides]
MKIIRRYKRPLGVLFTLLFLNQLFFPMVSYAITGNNNMPEYRSFEPVATTNMVSTFDGGFTYNIPVLEVPNGYPITLSYHSNDVNNEAQASWVGLGWTLNPGAINRVKRGFPDEFNNNQVTYHSKMPKNWTVTAGSGAGFEITGKNIFATLGISLGMSARYNNYNGFGTAITGGVNGLGGLASLNFNYSQGRFGFSPEINPGALLSRYLNRKLNGVKDKPTTESTPQDAKAEAEKPEEVKYDPIKEASNNIKASLAKIEKNRNSPHIGFGAGNSGGGSGHGFMYSPPVSFPTTVTPYQGLAVRLKAELGLNMLPAHVDPNFDVHGSYVEQKNVDFTTNQVYGYLHSEDALANNTSMMDYSTENEKMFEKRDKFLSIPLPNNDIYSVTGEALGGTFRPFRAEFGHYRKNFVKSETFSINTGGDFSLPVIPSPPYNLEYTAGANLGMDYQSLSVGDWSANGGKTFNGVNDFAESDENFFFRFSSDMGGSVDFTKYKEKPTDIGFKYNDDKYSPKLIRQGLEAYLDYGDYKGQVKLDERIGRSSYISQHTFRDFNALGKNNIRYKVYERNLKILKASPTNTYNTSSLVDYHANTSRYNQDGIAEFATYNADGVRYVYGLPLHTRNEKSMNYSLLPSEIDVDDLNENGLIAQVTSSNVHANAKRRLGYESSATYATQYLLTQITSPDYVDRNYDGPTTDDFGSYSKFNYVRVAGGNENTDIWYPYRTPHSGVSYDYGSLSEKNDNMGGYEYGEKELYYLRSICSKTHVAVFTLEDRKDAISPKLAGNLSDPYNDILKGSSTSASTIKQKCLSRIDLYAISDCNEIKDNSGKSTGIWEPKSGAVSIKTVRFHYSYQLCQGLKNTENSGGKLTLEKLWFEYEGKLTSKISPYVFKYQYPKSNEVNYTGKYSTFYDNYGGNSSLIENPNYNVLNSDRWGNYRNYSDMDSRYGTLARFFPFVDQKPSTSFDPAAWCLKRIILPSGGEIHVQYEQNDYQYVQDKRAMIMIPLDAATPNTSEGDNGKKYYLDLAKVGINLGAFGSDDKKALVHELFAPVKSERLFFNILYKLIGRGVPDINTTNSEYIEGYARIMGYGIDNGKAFFTFKEKGINPTGTDAFYEQVDYGNTNSKRELPQKVCKDFYKSQRRGKVDGGKSAMEDESSIADKIYGFIDLMQQIAEQSVETDICAQMDPEMSFVRLQSPYKKLGGGVRVKRLLMYDYDSNVSTEPSVYGNEYIYTTKDESGKVISSGVATNEPAAGRRESPLVNPLPKDEQTKMEALLYGRDMYSQEGPLGEGLLPSASIGYSKVTIKNIHQGLTSTGYEVHEFYTCKDFPFKADYTTLEQLNKTKLGISASGSSGGNSVGGGYSRHNPYMSQGYLFLINEMHGQVKRVAKYGKYETDQAAPVAEEIYEYYLPGEQVKMMDESMAIESGYLGKESEILGEGRTVADIMLGGDIGVDVSFGVYILPYPPVTTPLPISTAFSFNAYVNEQILHTHVVSKIIRYPAIVKRVTNIADGVRHVTENMVLDKFTGVPVVTKSYDDFNYAYLDQDIKASWNYKNMRPVSTNERLKLTGIFVKGTDKDPATGSDIDYLSMNLGAAAGCASIDNFVRGDFLEITKSNTIALYHVSDLDYENNRLVIAKSALNTGTLNNNDPVNIDVIKSGYTNQLSSKSGHIRFHDMTNPFTMNPPAKDADIDSLLTKLNNALTSGSSPATITKSTLPSTLMLKDPVTGGCIKANELPDDLYITKEAGSVKVEIGKAHQDGTKTVVKIPNSNKNPHQLVKDLNDFLNLIWGYKIANSYPYQAQRNNLLGGNYYRFYERPKAPLPFQGIYDLYNDKVYSNINGSSSSITFNNLFYLGDFAGAFAGSTAQDFANSILRITCKTGNVSIYSHLIPTPDVELNTTGTPKPYDHIYGLFGLRTAADVYHGLQVEQLYRAYKYDYRNTLYRLLTTPHTEIIGYFSQDDEGYLCYNKLIQNKEVETKKFCLRFYTEEQVPIIIPAKCSSPLVRSSGAVGTFSYNEKLGYIQYSDGVGCPQNVNCLKVCPKLPKPQETTNVVEASVSTYSDDWSYNASDYPKPSSTLTLNSYEAALKGKWRVQDAHVYRKNKDGYYEYANFNKGRFDLVMFNWANSSVNDPNKWVKTSTITSYSPNGSPLEDKNILNIYSASKFGYNNTLPVLVAQNAKKGNVAFESFENLYGSYFENGLTYTSSAGTTSATVSHTGSKSISLKPNASFKIADIEKEGQVSSEGVLVRAWIKPNKSKPLLDGKVTVVYGSNNSVTMSKVSGSGEWELYEGLISASQIISSNLGLTGNRFPVYIRISDPKNEYVQGDIYLDDIRVQPMQSEMVCYVYDKAQRLLATFDDQHFALVFEYNAEGVLVRKLKETIRGLKTISETQYNEKGVLR